MITWVLFMLQLRWNFIPWNARILFRKICGGDLFTVFRAQCTQRSRGGVNIKFGIAWVREIPLSEDWKKTKGSDKFTGCVQSDLPFDRQIHVEKCGPRFIGLIPCKVLLKSVITEAAQLSRFFPSAITGYSCNIWYNQTIKQLVTLSQF